MAKALIGYRRGPKLFLVPLGRVPSGGHIEVEPVSALDLDTPAADVGRSIVDTLELSDKQFDDPPVEALRSPAQVAAGSKSWRQFIHGTASCDVEQRENGYVITPLRPEKGQASVTNQSAQSRFHCRWHRRLLAKHSLKCCGRVRSTRDLDASALLRALSSFTIVQGAGLGRDAAPSFGCL